MDPAAPSVREAIRQTRPFATKRQEGLIALLLTSERVRWRLAQVLAAHGDLTLQQYNVLRILRGAGERGLPTLAIVERMIEHTPGITRLIDRLEAKKLVERARSAEDRRQVVCRLTARGLAQLARLDPVVEEFDERALGALAESEAGTLVRLLNKVRIDQA
ncbi:MAG TPA: MarR family transcriptional regulator [Planctomycetota bacterium]